MPKKADPTDSHLPPPRLAAMDRDRPKSSPIQHKRSISDLVTQPPTDSEDDSGSVTPSAPPTPMQMETLGVADLVSQSKMVYTKAHNTVLSAFETMERLDLSCLPVSRDGTPSTIFELFDHTDLNAYLLLVLGSIESTNKDPTFVAELEKARKGIPTSVAFAAQLGVKDPFVRVPTTEPLTAALRKFGNGVHRIAAVDEKNNVLGILSQRRMLDFIWTNVRRFPALESHLNRTLEEQQIGTYKDMLTISGESPVLEAFQLMHEHAVSSLAVVDKDRHLLGNISVADVALVTNSRNAALLEQSVKHFLTVILDERGLQEGKDSVPVFFVEPQSRLRMVVAKLVATKAHRLWIVEPTPDSTGRLVGVVSLTDIFNFIARQSGHLLDPERARRERRSSSSSTRSVSQIRKQLFS